MRGFSGFRNLALVLFPALWVALALFPGCQPQTIIVEREVTLEVEKKKVVREMVEVEKEVEAPRATPAPAAHGGTGSPAESVPLASAYRVGRMIIKNAELTLLVEDTAVGIDRVTQVAIDNFGYILTSRTWYQDGYQYATITIGVPSAEYENTIRRLRGLALKVLDENASGTDVTDEYVDLESRLRNLEATEIRIRAFLDKATTVEESLQVNQKLSEITGQIEEVKGRMNYLKDRAAYSTITVHLEPQAPTPTPTPTATPTPTPTPDVWRPGETFTSAGSVLGRVLRTVVDGSIWLAVVLGPFALPLAVFIWLVIRWRRTRRKPE